MENCNARIPTASENDVHPVERRAADRRGGKTGADIRSAAPTESQLRDAVTILRGALVLAECAIKGREHTGFITKALVATEFDLSAAAPEGFNYSTKKSAWPDFGDYVMIEQKRFGAPNEMFMHKVIQRFRSNSWIDIPAIVHEGARLHDDMEDVIAVVCCGISENTVLRYRVADVLPCAALAAPVEQAEQPLDESLFFPPKAMLEREDWDTATRKPKVAQQDHVDPPFAEPAVQQELTPFWQPITSPGQVNVGDKLRFTIGDDKYSETAKRILHPGTDKEEIIYNKRQNYYLITSMAMANKGSQKNVEFLPVGKLNAASDESSERAPTGPVGSIGDDPEFKCLLGNYAGAMECASTDNTVEGSLAELVRYIDTLLAARKGEKA